MGGDLGPRVTIPAAINIANGALNVELILVGDQEQLQKYLPSLSASVSGRVHILHAPDTVSMNDKPAQVLRSKRKSSMWIALDLLKQGKVDACVSAGNTGALMAMGKLLLRTFPGIDRPAICKPVPCNSEGGDTGHCYLLDLGANIKCDSDQLLQFAIMGSVLAGAVDNNEQPTVGLLNIGEEDIKGNEQVKLASKLFTDNEQINYIGYVEGDGIYAGKADVVVCDGFAGNVVLKASEGVAKLLASRIEKTFKSSFYGRLAGQIARPVLLKLRTQFDPGRYNGASFLGLQGTLIKSHGGADTDSFAHAITMAKEQVEKQIPQRINEQFAARSV